jgi:hypothetical protein
LGNVIENAGTGGGDLLRIGNGTVIHPQDHVLIGRTIGADGDRGIARAGDHQRARGVKAQTAHRFGRHAGCLDRFTHRFGDGAPDFG